MNGITLLLVSVAILVIGYIFYGRYLCKKWGVGELEKRPEKKGLERDRDEQA